MPAKRSNKTARVLNLITNSGEAEQAEQQAAAPVPEEPQTNTTTKGNDKPAKETAKPAKEKPKGTASKNTKAKDAAPAEPPQPAAQPAAEPVSSPSAGADAASGGSGPRRADCTECPREGTGTVGRYQIRPFGSTVRSRSGGSAQHPSASGGYNYACGRRSCQRTACRRITTRSRPRICCIRTSSRSGHP